MIALGFRTKLLLAMMMLVAGVTGATIYLAEDQIEKTYEREIDAQIQQRITYFSDLQEARLGSIKQRCLDLNKSVRLQAALEDGGTDLLYDREQALFQLRDVLGEPGEATVSAKGTGPIKADFLCFLDASGKTLPPPAREAALLPEAVKVQIERNLTVLRPALTNAVSLQQVGYLAPEMEHGQSQLHEVILTEIMKPDSQQSAGALILGFPMLESSSNAPGRVSEIKSGIWLKGELHSEQIPPVWAPILGKEIMARSGITENEEGKFDLPMDGIPAWVFFRRLNPGSNFPKAYQIWLYSLKEMREATAVLRAKILGFGGLALLGALAISLVLSQGLSAPIKALVRGTAEIQRGNFGVKVPVRSRDEIGRLAASFNDMAEGLALKERYKSVLNMVTDKKVAQEIMSGRVALGGETREISVLFCDIRGFTPLTQNMDPAEVIRLLNEHMTVLSRVVDEHEGVVDKYVGDLIMAVFGAPKSYGHDAYDAARCALRMIQERQKLNETSRYKINIGIGVATGKAVAGCMGSSDRNNYTVLGERVNLASRLCGKAAKMEVLIDETTYARLANLVEAEALPELELKGFSGCVTAYKLIEVHPFPTALA